MEHSSSDSMDSLARLALEHSFSNEQKQLQQCNFYAAKSLLQVGMTTSDLKHAKNCLQQACEILESTDIEKYGCISPFPLLMRARHRLGQIATVEGKMIEALQMFKSILNHEYSSMASPLTLSLIWYDVALIFSSLGRPTSQVLDTLDRANMILFNKQESEGILDHKEEVVLYYIEQAITRIRFYCHQMTRPSAGTVCVQQFDHSNLPSSLEFTFLAPSQKIQSMAKLLVMDPSIRAAAVA